MTAKVKLSIAVMAIPERARGVGVLKRGLGSVVKVVWDHEHRGTWWNAERAWRSMRGGATHHLVLQDDVTVCEDFPATVVAALAHAPYGPVGFYANVKEVEEARERGDSWVSYTWGLWGQAMCLPAPMVGQFLRWQKLNVKPDYPWDDGRMSLFCEATGIRSHLTVPSLVDHMGDLRSSVGNRAPMARRARWYVGHDQTAADVDWSKGLDGDILKASCGGYIKGHEKWMLRD